MEKIPFKVGQHAEELSFDSGYRGAWFQCKIKEIITRNGILGYISEYPAYPDQVLQWIELYQVPPYCTGNAKQNRKELMLRPKYPPIYNENQIPDISEISEVIVIVCDSWKVGDLVDCLYDKCYWTGRITKIFRKKAQVELKPPPHGEGSSCKVIFKDIRPSLDWSLEYGWTLPTQESGTGRHCARLIKPINQGQETEVVKSPVELYSRLPFSSPISSKSAGPSKVKRKRTIVIKKRSLGMISRKQDDREKGSHSISRKQDDREKGSHSISRKQDDREKGSSYECGGISTMITNRAAASTRHCTSEQMTDVVKDDLNCRSFKVNGGGTPNSKYSNTLEASVLDLEEYINKVKWLKKILKHGISSYEAQRPQWVFYEPSGM